jgi:hypothetical protein
MVGCAIRFKSPIYYIIIATSICQILVIACVQDFELKN